MQVKRRRQTFVLLRSARNTGGGFLGVEIVCGWVSIQEHLT